jgi:tyrosine-protein kinase Etk/Wzc
VLAKSDPSDPAIEALRSLRTNLQFALTESSSNIIAIEGPAPSVGKSFVACNFAHVLAAFGERVLLIDGDLRRGILHRAFGLDRAPGMSDVLSSDVTLSSALRHTAEPNLDFLSSGTHRPNPSEMLGSARLRQLLDQASSAYDLVLVDTPPVLAVTDAALVARCAGVNLLVLRSGEHNAREIKVALKRLRHAGAPMHGIIINDALMGASRYGRYGQYGYYRYEYTGK